MPTELQQLVAELPGGAVIRAGRMGLELAPGIEPEHWRHLVTQLARLAHSAVGARQTVTAWLGDALAYAETSYRGRIVTCAYEAGLEPGTLRNAKMVCCRIPVSCRHDGLTWSHHCEVGLAFDDRTEIERWLAMAEKENLSTRELRRRIRADIASRVEDPGTSADSVSIDAFQMLRELRSICRALDQRRAVWRRWSPATARLGLQELDPLADFIDHLRTRALSGASSRPRDIQAN